MLHADLDQFKNNMGAYSEEQGEPRCDGQYNENMMGDYVSRLINFFVVYCLLLFLNRSDLNTKLKFV